MRPVLIQRRPQRIVVIDMIGQAEHDRVIRKAGGRVDKMLKCVDRHNRVDRRDDRGSAGKPSGDELKARVGRRGRAHDQVEIKTLTVLAEPSPAIVALFVDDDGHSVDANRAKTIKGVLDQGPSADWRHRLADAIAIGA